MNLGPGVAPVSDLARGLAAGLMDGDRRPAGVVGVGVDAVDVARLRRLIARRSRLADRLFTPAELAYARAVPDPAPRLATRFAAKEAVMKVFGVGLWAYPFHDVEVVRTGLAAPGLVLSGTAAVLARRAGVARWHLSLTHTESVALALVVADAGPVSPATGVEDPTGRPSEPPEPPGPPATS